MAPSNVEMVCGYNRNHRYSEAEHKKLRKIFPLRKGRKRGQGFPMCKCGSIVFDKVGGDAANQKGD